MKRVPLNNRPKRRRLNNDEEIVENPSVSTRVLRSSTKSLQCTSVTVQKPVIFIRPLKDPQKRSLNTAPTVKSTRTLRSAHSIAQNVCNIDQLPDCVLEHLFGYFDSEERKELSLVSKRWMNVAFSYPFASRCPLTFEHCIFRAGSEPKKTFDKTRNYRQFPCVQIGNVEGKPLYGWFKNDGDLVHFYNAMQSIGDGTTHLTLTDREPPPLVLSCFPNLKQLHMIDLDYIVNFVNIPETLETIYVTTANLWVSHEVYLKLKSLKHIKYLYCSKLDWKYDPINTPRISLLDFTEELDRYLRDHRNFGSMIEVSSNLMSDDSIDFNHVIGLTLSDGFVHHEDLVQFINLKKVKFITRNICFNFHQEVKMDSVKTFKLILDDENNLNNRIALMLEDHVESMCNQCFNNFLSSFVNVDGVKVTHLISDSQVIQLFSAYPSMKRLTLNTIKLSDNAFLDLSFQNLKKLEKLHLIEDRYAFYQEGLLDFENDVDNKTMEILWCWPYMPLLRKLKLHFKMEGSDGSITDDTVFHALNSMIKKLPNIRYFSHGIKLDDGSKPGYGIELFLAKIQKRWPKIVHLDLNINEYYFFYHSYVPIDNLIHFNHLKFLHLQICTDPVHYDLSIERIYSNLPSEQDRLLQIFKNNKRLQYIHGGDRYYRDHQHRIVPNKIMYREMSQNYRLFLKQRKMFKIIHKWLLAFHLKDTGDMDLNIKNIRLKRLERIETELSGTLQDEFGLQPYTEKDERYWRKEIKKLIVEWDFSDYRYLKYHDPTYPYDYI